MTRWLGWGAAALVMTTLVWPASAKPGDASSSPSGVKARPSTRSQRVGLEILLATVGMAGTLVLADVLVSSADQECGSSVEPGAPDSYCQPKKGGLVRAGAALVAGSLLLPPAGAAIAGAGAGNFGTSVLGALVGLAGGLLVAVPASQLNEGAAYIALMGGVVAGTVIGYELSVPRATTARASLSTNPVRLRVQPTTLPRGGGVIFAATF
jgi:hypothetical protein